MGIKKGKSLSEAAGLRRRAVDRLKPVGKTGTVIESFKLLSQVRSSA